MKQETFRYPASIQITKLFGKLVALLIPVLILLFLILGWMYPTRADFNIPVAVITAILFPVIFTYFAYSWPEIEIRDEGLLVEFLWFNLEVPWSDVIDIKPIPTHFIHIWLVRTDGLTIFHRLYGLLNGLIFKPCFLIHSSLENHQLLIEEIKRQIRKTRA